MNGLQATQDGDGLFERLSVVIPVGPGDATWHALVAQLSQSAPRLQVLLVFATGDAQASDAPGHCKVVIAQAGRAHQLNTGIAAADREWLWLLHADSRLWADALPALRTHLGRSTRGLGWFRLAFEDGPWPMRLNAWGANLRARWLGLPFGDQGFVLHRDEAQRLGPFDPALPFGEDHAMVWHARRIGLPLRRIDGTIATSARKYARHGWWRITWLHLRLTATQAWHASRGR